MALFIAFKGMVLGCGCSAYLDVLPGRFDRHGRGEVLEHEPEGFGLFAGHLFLATLFFLGTVDSFREKLDTKKVEK